MQRDVTMEHEEKPKFNLSSQVHNLDRSSLQTTYLWTREYSGGNVVASNAVYLDRQPPQPTIFERLLHTVARKTQSRGAKLDELKVRQWQEDDRCVRDGTCTFQVQYLGSVEVQHSKGIQLCEDVIKTLKLNESSSARKKNELTGHHWATMRITSEMITVNDDETQNVICEDSIKSISFCTAHRRYEKCFAYICRLAPSEHRWTCHAFSAITATGERINHAVGCAFEACHQNRLNSGNNNIKEEEEVELDQESRVVVTSEQHHTARRTEDAASRVPDASIARPRPSIDSKSSGTVEASIELKTI